MKQWGATKFVGFGFGLRVAVLETVAYRKDRRGILKSAPKDLFSSHIRGGVGERGDRNRQGGSRLCHVLPVQCSCSLRPQQASSSHFPILPSPIASPCGVSLRKHGVYPMQTFSETSRDLSCTPPPMFPVLCSLHSPRLSTTQLTGHFDSQPLQLTRTFATVHRILA